MHLKLSHVRLLVADYATAFAFYSGTLGLPARFSDVAGGYGEFDTGTVSLALFDRRKMALALGSADEIVTGSSLGRPVLTFFVADVDALWRDLQAKGVVFLTPPTNRPEWTVRTAHFQDPDGNLIEINGDLRRGG